MLRGSHVAYEVLSHDSRIFVTVNRTFSGAEKPAPKAGAATKHVAHVARIFLVMLQHPYFQSNALCGDVCPQFASMHECHSRTLRPKITMFRIFIIVLFPWCFRMCFPVLLTVLRAPPRDCNRVIVIAHAEAQTSKFEHQKNPTTTHTSRRASKFSTIAGFCIKHLFTARAALNAEFGGSRSQ